MKTKVAIRKCKSYSLEQVKKTILLMLNDLGGLQTLVKKQDSVLLKPNLLTSKKPEKAVTTHPIIVEAVILILKEYGIKKIGLGDSPALESTEKVLKVSGIEDVCKKHEIQILTFRESTKIVNKDNKIVKEFNIAKEFFEFDKIINLPKMKTHSFTVFTGATKNIFGFISGKSKMLFHMKHKHPIEFSDMLLDLNNIVKPELNIMDGITGMEGNGPNGGDPRNFGILLASKSNIALDTCMSKIMNINRSPLSIAAKKRNYKDSEIKNIEVLGDKISNLIQKNVVLPKTGILFGTRNFLGNLRKITAKKPILISEKCISCRKCEDICPADAIKINEKPLFDYKKCIRCYCCHEVCPVNAIDLKRNLNFFE